MNNKKLLLINLLTFIAFVTVVGIGFNKMKNASASSVDHEEPTTNEVKIKKEANNVFGMRRNILADMSHEIALFSGMDELDEMELKEEMEDEIDIDIEDEQVDSEEQEEVTSNLNTVPVEKPKKKPGGIPYKETIVDSKEENNEGNTENENNQENEGIEENEKNEEINEENEDKEGINAENNGDNNGENTQNNNDGTTVGGVNEDFNASKNDN